MAIRKSGASSISSGSVSSFLKGYSSNAAALKKQQEDADYQNGLITDNDYIDILNKRALSSGTTAVQKAQIKENINTIRINSERSQISADINNGTKDYSDLVSFEKDLLNTMTPGSINYNNQLAKVDSAIGSLVSSARNRMNQDIQNGNSTLQDLANFENSVTSIYLPGTKAYEEQISRVQDAERNATKDQFNQQKKRFDIDYANALLKAKDAGDIQTQANLYDQKINQLREMSQMYPQYYDQTALETEINQLAISKRDAVENYYNKMDSSQKKAIKSGIAEQYNAFKDAEKIANDQIKQLMNSGKSSNEILNGFQDKDGNRIPGVLEIQQNLLQIANQVKSGLDQYATTNPDLVGDKMYLLKNSIDDLTQQVSQTQARSQAPGSTQLEVGGFGGAKITDARVFNKNGTPSTFGTYSTKGQFKDAVTGEYNKIAPDAIFTVIGDNNTARQYANVNGVLYSREIKQGDDTTAIDFIPADMNTILGMESNAPTVVKYMGIDLQKIKSDITTAKSEIAKTVQEKIQSMDNLKKLGQNWTENTLIPELNATYAGKLSEQEIKNAVYEARKPFEDSIANKIEMPQPAPAPVEPAPKPVSTPLSTSDVSKAVTNTLYTPGLKNVVVSTPTMTAAERANAEATAYATNIWEGTKNKGGLSSLGDFYTEKTLIPELQSKYKLSDQQAKDIAYNTRKPYEAESLLKNLSTKLNPR